MVKETKAEEIKLEMDGIETGAADMLKADKAKANRSKADNPRLESEAQTIKGVRERLEKQKKVRIKIRPTTDKDTQPVPVVINECCYLIKKGEYVDVPEDVAKLLEEADYI